MISHVIVTSPEVRAAQYRLGVAREHLVKARLCQRENNPHRALQELAQVFTWLLITREGLEQ